jgi:hypothetical protein
MFAFLEAQSYKPMAEQLFDESPAKKESSSNRLQCGFDLSGGGQSEARSSNRKQGSRTEGGCSVFLFTWRRSLFALSGGWNLVRVLCL